ncbi:MAG: hypothetical protein ACREVJ_12010, partial [Gammaproteobacteria bacterium]
PMTTPLTIVNENERFPKVPALMEPTTSGYILDAAMVDRRPPFLPNSRKKRELISLLKRRCQELEGDPNVVSAVVFEAVIIPPGRGEFIKQRRKARIARFDLAILIETESPEAIDAVKESPIYAGMERAIERASADAYSIAATNVRRMAPVDHRRQGVFLFNYFFADDTAQNLAIWEYTAGWFQKETGLDNSTVLLPRDGERTDYRIINHCRWDRLRDVLPSLLFKRSFRNYVLANFEANKVAAMPILYRIS